jgi:DNA-directed DNA polymerase III PolC
MYLNCHSYYSFKFGTLSPEELLQDAKKFGIRSFALTDINNTSGVLDFIRMAAVDKYNIKPVVGIDFRNGAEQKFIGIAKNNEGFYELNKFLSDHLENEKAIPNRAPEFENCFIIYPLQAVQFPLRENEFAGIRTSDFFKLQTAHHKLPEAKLVVLAPITFRTKRDFNAHRLLRAVDKNTVLSKLEVSEQAQPDECMLPENVLPELYKDHPQMIRNTKRILDECEINFVFQENKNKKYFTGSESGDREKLVKLCDEGLKYRYPNAGDNIRERLEMEIGMIYKKDFISYFLINHDIVQYAQRKNFFYVGRGSGANSMVAYLLKITDVDPIDLDLYFERFINPSRTNPPDFDIDFSWRDRDEIIKYIFHKHGTDHTALLATYSTFQSNSMVRELGKVFGLPKEEIDSLQDKYENHNSPDKTTQLIFTYANHIHEFPSHLSVHAGGILISELPIHCYTSTVLTQKNFLLTQFSMLEAEDVGLYKFDILSQRGLGKIKDALEIILQNKNEEIDIHDITRFKNDEKVRENLRTANLMGCFYVESPAMRMLLTKLEAKEYKDLVAASSIIRPGVAQSGMMQEYIRRFHKQQPAIGYANSILDRLMEETFGVMVYQEDVIKVAHHFAGLTLGEADMLRRGMGGKYRAREEFQKVEKKFFSNCKEKGYEDSLTKEVWRQIESFAGYAFSKGHSASYAVESYQCMFLKTHYPLEFMVAVINNEGGFFSKEFYVHEVKMCGGNILLPDINKSDVLTKIYGEEIFLGLNMIAELEEKVREEIVIERKRNGEFLSLENFMMRITIATEQLRLLIRIGAFRFTRRTKKQLLWDVYSIIGGRKKSEARKELFPIEKKHFSLPDLDDDVFDDARDETELLGFTLCPPFDLLKEKMPSQLVAADLKNLKGEIISIVGYLVTRKHTHTKKGADMSFGTFLDKNGIFFDTTHFPNVFKQFPFQGKGCYLITGKVAEEFKFFSIDVIEMQKLGNVLFEQSAYANS